MTLKEISSFPFVDYYSTGSLARQWIKHHFKRNAGPLQVRAYAAAVDFVLELVIKNLGVAVVPKYVAEPFLEKGRLYPIQTGRPEMKDSIWLNVVRIASSSRHPFIHPIQLSSTANRLLKILSLVRPSRAQ